MKQYTENDIREAIKQSLMEYRMRHTQIEDSDEGLPLIDMFTPRGAKDVSWGISDVETLPDGGAGLVMKGNSSVHERRALFLAVYAGIEMLSQKLKDGNL